MKQNKVVLLDIDHTIFDTDILRTNIYTSLAKKLGYNDLESLYALVKETEQETKKEIGYFKTQVFLERFHRKLETSLPLVAIEEIFFDDSFYHTALYSDAVSVLQELTKKNDIEIIIFSTGEKDFQMRKIASLKHLLKEDQIRVFIDKITKLEETLQEYHSHACYIVDDLPRVLKAAKQFDKRVTTIWVNREKKFEDTELIQEFIADYEIKELNEIIPIVVGH